MVTKFKFEKLMIWHKAMDLAESLNSLSIIFPEKEKFNLTSQICRSADSIALNISEGSLGQSNPEQRKFMGYAIRSLAEVVTCLHKARKRNYISLQEFNLNYEESFNLMNMMISSKRNIN